MCAAGLPTLKEAGSSKGPFLTLRPIIMILCRRSANFEGGWVVQRAFLALRPIMIVCRRSANFKGGRVIQRVILNFAANGMIVCRRSANFEGGWVVQRAILSFAAGGMFVCRRSANFKGSWAIQMDILSFAANIIIAVPARNRITVFRLSARYFSR